MSIYIGGHGFVSISPEVSKRKNSLLFNDKKMKCTKGMMGKRHITAISKPNNLPNVIVPMIVYTSIISCKNIAFY